MSFLWGGSSNQEVIQGENKCKECIDKNKRLVDYNLFFNELQNVLKKKEGEISELLTQITQLNHQINELNTIQENTEFSVITLNAHKGRLEREIEKQKELFQEEKKKWLDDKLGLEDNQCKIHEELVFYREMSSNLENELEDLEDEKLIWKQHKKVLDEKVENLIQQIQTLKNKSEALEANQKKKEEEEINYQERIDELSENFRISEEQYLELAKKYARDMLVKEEEWREKEEDLINEFRRKIESLEEELVEKEQLWKSREEEYEFMIQRYQENEEEYELKIQELKYETEYELDKIQSSYRKKEDESLEYWENRIEELNQNYDQELLTFKDKLKAREDALNREKEYLEFDLRKEMEDIKIENEKLSLEKKELEKKRIENVLEIKGLKSDNEWLEMQWNQEQELIERLRNEKEDLEEAQKKLESELLNVKEEMLKNQRILEETLLEKSKQFWQPENHMDLVDQVRNENFNQKEKEQERKQEEERKQETNTELDNQIIDSSLLSEGTDLISSCIEGGLRKRIQPKKKNKKYLNHENKSNFVHPSVYEMTKNEDGIEKKNLSSNVQKKRKTTLWW